VLGGGSEVEAQPTLSSNKAALAALINLFMICILFIDP